MLPLSLPVRKEWKPRPPPITLEQVVHLAREVLLHDGYHPPTLIADGTKRVTRISIRMLAPNHEEQTDQLATIGGALAHDHSIGKLRSVFFIKEAWLSQAVEGTLPEMRTLVNGLIRLAEKPHQVRLVILEMIRDEQGTLGQARNHAFRDKSEVAANTQLLMAFLSGYWMKSSLR